MKTSNKAQLRVFLSYASEQENIAEQIYLTLSNSGHEVFFDRTNLPPGEDYNPTILEAIRSSDLFVFLISPHSIEKGAYTLTELRFARENWPYPADHILPVMAFPTKFAKIPSYLKAVTILRPEGNLTAEVAASVNDIAAGRKPEDTFLGQLDFIEKTANKFHYDFEISELDKAWEQEKKRYIVKVNNKEVIPSMEALVGQGVIFLVLAFFSFFFLSRFGRGTELIFIAIGVSYLGYFYFRVKQYEKAEGEHTKKKAEIFRQYRETYFDEDIE